MFWPEGSPPAEGERVVTSAEAGAFPAGLPVGVVHYAANNVPEVEPYARLDQLEVVRVFDYGMRGLLPPEAPPPSRPHGSGPARGDAVTAGGRAHPRHPAAPDPRAPARRRGAERVPVRARRCCSCCSPPPRSACRRQAELQQALTLASVFFWSLFRPAAMPPPAVFLLGLLMDLLGLAPLGTGIITLLIVHGVALRWRRAMVPQGFLLVWLAFIGVAAGAAALGWALGSLLAFRLLPPLAGAVPVRAVGGALSGARHGPHPRASRDRRSRPGMTARVAR